MSTSPYSKAVGVLRMRCPGCGKAKIFHRTKFPFKKPLMKDVCESCGYRFDRDPGFFSGAVWLSYGLAIVEGVIAFFLARQLIYGLSMTKALLIAIALMLILAMWNYRMARVMWLNLFPV